MTTRATARAMSARIADIEKHLTEDERRKVDQLLTKVDPAKLATPPALHYLTQRQRDLAVTATAAGGADVKAVAEFAETTPAALYDWVAAGLDADDPRHEDAAPWLRALRGGAATFLARKANELRPHLTAEEIDQVDELLKGWTWLQGAPTFADILRAEKAARDA